MFHPHRAISVGIGREYGRLRLRESMWNRGYFYAVPLYDGGSSSPDFFMGCKGKGDHPCVHVKSLSAGAGLPADTLYSGSIPMPGMEIPCIRISRQGGLVNYDYQSHGHLCGEDWTLDIVPLLYGVDNPGIYDPPITLQVRIAVYCGASYSDVERRCGTYRYYSFGIRCLKHLGKESELDTVYQIEGLPGSTPYCADLLAATIGSWYRSNPIQSPEMINKYAPKSWCRDLLAQISLWVDKMRQDSGFVRAWPTDSELPLVGVPSSDRNDDRVESGFYFNEPEIFGYGKPAFMPIGNAYWFDSMREHAFFDACSNLPALSDNSISNTQEILEFLLSLIRREPPSIPKSLSDAWLAYRYSYSTTKADVQEAVKFVQRYIDLGSLSSTITSYGSDTIYLGDCEITMRCEIKARSRTLSGIDNLWAKLSQYGYAPDLYWLWDSTPFSFIADWFIPIGDVASAWDGSVLFDSDHYDFDSIGYSLSYEREVSGTRRKFYSRWYDREPPRIHALYWLDSRYNPSNRLVAFRALDAYSLFIGNI